MQAIQVSTEKSGGYRTVKIPEEYFRDIKVPGNGLVEISRDENDRISINGIMGFKTMEERLVEFYGEDYERKCREDYDQFRKEHGVIERGPPVGHEIW